MNKRITPFLSSICVALIATSAVAQEPRLADRLVELTRIEQSMAVMESSIVQGIRQGWMNRMEQERQRLSQDEIERLTNLLPEFETIMKEEMGSFRSAILPEIKKQGAAFYEARLSSDELEELVGILERPSLQKLFDLQPEAGQIGTEIALRYTADFQERIERRLGELIRKASQK